MSHISQLLIILVVILLSAKYLGWLSSRWGQPAVFGQLLAGLILGPTLLNILDWPIFLHRELAVSSHSSLSAVTSPLEQTIWDLAELGVIFLMFLAGLETDLKQMMHLGKTAFWAAMGGVSLPLVLGTGTSLLFFLGGIGFSLYECIFIGVILTATSVSITAQTLMELGKLRSREGTTILAAAVIDDILGIILLSLVVAFKPPLGNETTRAEHLLDYLMEGIGDFAFIAVAPGFWRILFLFVLILTFVLLAFSFFPLLHRLATTLHRLPIPEGLLVTVLAGSLFYAWMAGFIGNLAAITGSYFLGVLFTRTELQEEIREKVHGITYGFFAGIFFVSIGMQANVKEVLAPLIQLKTITREELLLLLFMVAIIIVAILSKVLGCLFGARFTGFTWKEAYRVGVGMVSRGEVGLIIAAVGLSTRVINVEVFSMMVLMVLVSTMITPIWLKRAFASSEP